MVEARLGASVGLVDGLAKLVLVLGNAKVDGIVVPISIEQGAVVQLWVVEG